MTPSQAVRGGSWWCDLLSLSMAGNRLTLSTHRFPSFGFRCLRTQTVLPVVHGGAWANLGIGRYLHISARSLSPSKGVLMGFRCVRPQAGTPLTRYGIVQGWSWLTEKSVACRLSGIRNRYLRSGSLPSYGFRCLRPDEPTRIQIAYLNRMLGGRP